MCHKVVLSSCIEFQLCVYSRSHWHHGNALWGRCSSNHVCFLCLKCCICDTCPQKCPPSSRIWTSDLRMSAVLSYSPPLYQLSYRRDGGQSKQTGSNPEQAADVSTKCVAVLHLWTDISNSACMALNYQTFVLIQHTNAPYHTKSQRAAEGRSIPIIHWFRQQKSEIKFCSGGGQSGKNTVRHIRLNLGDRYIQYKHINKGET